MTSSTFEDIMVNLVWNGNGWTFTVTGGSNPSISNWLAWNRNAVLSDGKTINLLENIEFIINHDLDSNMTSARRGFGCIHAGYNAIPTEVWNALNWPTGSHYQYSIALLRRKGNTHVDRAGGRTPSTAGNPPSSSDYWYDIYERRWSIEWTPALTDNVTMTRLRDSDNYAVNHDYRDSGIYINEDNQYIKLRAPLFPNYNTVLNSQQKVVNYQASPCGTVPWPAMSIVNGGNFFGVSPCAGLYDFEASVKGTAPCNPVLCGLDFYGGPLDIDYMSSLSNNWNCSITRMVKGGNTDPTNRELYFGSWYNYDDYAPISRTDITYNINYKSGNIGAEILCPIKAIAAYEFSKKCYNAGECDNDNYWSGAHKTWKSWYKRCPNYERFYYTVGLIREHLDNDNNVDKTELLVIDSVRWVDKDDMPRLTNSNQIDWRATNQLWLDHLYVFSPSPQIYQVYSDNIVQTTLPGYATVSLTMSFAGGHGVPENPGWMFQNNVYNRNCPWYNRFKVAVSANENGWWGILGLYPDGWTKYARCNNTIWDDPSRCSYNGGVTSTNLQALAFVLLPKWFLNAYNK